MTSNILKPRVIEVLTPVCWQTSMEILKTIEFHCWEKEIDTCENLHSSVKTTLSNLYKQKRIERRKLEGLRATRARMALNISRGSAGYEYRLL